MFILTLISARRCAAQLHSQETAVKMIQRSQPVPERLDFKVGAQVILLKNYNPEGGLVNGSRGVIIDWVSDPKLENNASYEDGDMSSAIRRCAPHMCFPKVRFTNGREQVLYPSSWSVNQAGKKAAWRVQMQLQLAYALTVHKSQGMTLDRVRLNLSSVFEAGQAYVALSRIRSIESLSLESFPEHVVKANPKALHFYDSIKPIDPQLWQQWSQEAASMRAKASDTQSRDRSGENDPARANGIHFTNGTGPPASDDFERFAMTKPNQSQHQASGSASDPPLPINAVRSLQPFVPLRPSVRVSSVAAAANAEALNAAGSQLQGSQHNATLSSALATVKSQSQSQSHQSQSNAPAGQPATPNHSWNDIQELEQLEQHVHASNAPASSQVFDPLSRQANEEDFDYLDELMSQHDAQLDQSKPQSRLCVSAPAPPLAVTPPLTDDEDCQIVETPKQNTDKAKQNHQNQQNQQNHQNQAQNQTQNQAQNQAQNQPQNMKQSPIEQSQPGQPQPQPQAPSSSLSGTSLNRVASHRSTPTSSSDPERAAKKARLQLRLAQEEFDFQLSQERKRTLQASGEALEETALGTPPAQLLSQSSTGASPLATLNCAPFSFHSLVCSQHRQQCAMQQNDTPQAAQAGEQSAAGEQQPGERANQQPQWRIVCPSGCNFLLTALGSAPTS